MTEIAKKTTMLALRMQQAEEIRQAVACFIPENAENQEVFSKNCLFYIIKNKAVMSDNWLTINNIQVDLFEFLQKMYEMSRCGLSLIDGDFSVVTYAGGQVVCVPEWRAERRIAESKGLTITFLHGKAGDEFMQEANPLKHTFSIRPRKGSFSSISEKEITTKNGGKMKVRQVTNDVIWYAVVAETADGQRFSYVESTENILMRANPKTLQFYNDPNAQHTMYEKFVLRQLLKRLPSNLRGVDFDKVDQPDFEDTEYAEYEDVAPTNVEAKVEEKKPKVLETKLLPLVEGSETWFKMIDSIRAKKVTYEQIARKYDTKPFEAQIRQFFADADKSVSESENNEESPLKLEL